MTAQKLALLALGVAALALSSCTLVIIGGPTLPTKTSATEAPGTPAQTTPTPEGHSITVTLTDTTPTASATTFRAGVSYHFDVTNQGRFPHQFWLTPQGMQQIMQQMPMEQWQQQILYTSQTIAPPTTTSFDFTFTGQMIQRQLAFTCYTPSGYSAGGPSLSELPIQVTA
jgi:uncharacterized cupredoxin-like copper-binding protein